MKANVCFIIRHVALHTQPRIQLGYTYVYSTCQNAENKSAAHPSLVYSLCSEPTRLRTQPFVLFCIILFHYRRHTHSRTLCYTTTSTSSTLTQCCTPSVGWLRNPPCYARAMLRAKCLHRCSCAWRPSCTRNLVLPVHPSTVNLRIHSLLRLLAVLFTHRLRSELDACIAANARMEAELHKQSAAASTRLAELQDSYTAKVRGRQLRS